MSVLQVGFLSQDRHQKVRDNPAINYSRFFFVIVIIALLSFFLPNLSNQATPSPFFREPEHVGPGELFKQYKVEKLLGKGKNGAVELVRNITTNVTYALKSVWAPAVRYNQGQVYNDTETQSAMTFMLDAGITPHILRTHRIFVESHGYLPKTLYLNDVAMGTQYKPHIRLSPNQLVTFSLQYSHAASQLSSFGITGLDLFCGNRFYTAVSDKIVFRGERLNAFDYWKYTLDGNAFYIPRPRYMMLIGDYFDVTTVSFPLRYQPRSLAPNHIEPYAAYRARFDAAWDCITWEGATRDYVRIMTDFTRVPSANAAIFDMDYSV